jgi:hypothetical protein
MMIGVNVRITMSLLVILGKIKYKKMSAHGEWLQNVFTRVARLQSRKK